MIWGYPHFRKPSYDTMWHNYDRYSDTIWYMVHVSICTVCAKELGYRTSCTLLYYDLYNLWKKIFVAHTIRTSGLTTTYGLMIVEGLGWFKTKHCQVGWVTPCLYIIKNSWVIGPVDMIRPSGKGWLQHSFWTSVRCPFRKSETTLLEQKLVSMPFHSHVFFCVFPPSRFQNATILTIMFLPLASTIAILIQGGLNHVESPWVFPCHGWDLRSHLPWATADH